MLRTYDGKGYVMVTTDMSNRKSRSWFNHGIDLLRSDDLIHWESVFGGALRLFDPILRMCIVTIPG